jgi:hypothetical protein
MLCSAALAGLPCADWFIASEAWLKLKLALSAGLLLGNVGAIDRVEKDEGNKGWPGPRSSPPGSNPE